MGTQSNQHLAGLRIAMTLHLKKSHSYGLIVDTLRRVEDENPWTFEKKGKGIAFPRLYPLGVARNFYEAFDANRVITGSAEITWTYGPGDTITASQEAAFIRYLDRIRNRLELDLDLKVTGLTVTRDMFFVYD